MTHTAGDDLALIPRIELRHRLAIALDHAGLRPADMVAELDVHRNTVSGYMTGRTRPSRAVLRVWALRTGVSFEWLNDGGEGMRDISRVTLRYPATFGVAA